MWIHYAAQHWTKAEDIESSIERLSNIFYALCQDSEHNANYQIYWVLDENEFQQRCMDDVEKFRNGVELCNKYFDKILNLEEFCAEIVKANLKHFLCEIYEYLSKEIIEKFQLKW